MEDTIKMILGWLIIPTIIFIGTTIESLGLLIGHLFTIFAGTFGIIVIGQMIIALAAFILCPFLCNNK